MYGIIASVLHTGNIEFDEKEASHGGDACVITNMQLVEYGELSPFLECCAMFIRAIIFVKTKFLKCDFPYSKMSFVHKFLLE